MVSPCIMSWRPSTVQCGPHECGPHCQQEAGLSALAWPSHLLTTSLFGVFLENSLFHLTALTQFEKCTAERGSGLQFFGGVPPFSLLCFFLFSTEEREDAFSVHNPNLNFANVRRCWFDLCVQNPPKCTVERRGYAFRRRGVPRNY